MAERWLELTSTELAAASQAGETSTLVIPLGSVEAHGPHLPIGTDCYVAEGLADTVADRIGQAVVAPTIAVAYAPRTNYPGTISFAPEVVRQLIQGYCRAAVEVGSSSVILLPAHAESFQVAWLVAPEMGELFPSLRIMPFLSIDKFLSVRNDALSDFGLSAAEGGWHAGAAETSVMMAMHPEMVRMDMLKPGYVDDVDHRLPDSFTFGFRHLSEDGIFGDPTKARPDIGQAIVTALVDVFLGGIGRSLGP